MAEIFLCVGFCPYLCAFLILKSVMMTMKRYYSQPVSCIEAVETTELLGLFDLSEGYGDVQYAPSKQYEK